LVDRSHLDYNFHLQQPQHTLVDHWGERKWNLGWRLGNNADKCVSGDASGDESELGVQSQKM